LASPSGSWTAELCSCPRAGKTQSKEAAIAQVKIDLADINPPAGCSDPYLRRKSDFPRYKKLSGVAVETWRRPRKNSADFQCGSKSTGTRKVDGVVFHNQYGGKSKKLERQRRLG
jgi:hypothetical protein